MKTIVRFAFLVASTAMGCQNRNKKIEIAYIFTDSGYRNAKLSFTVNDSLTLIIKKENDLETYYPIFVYHSSSSQEEGLFVIRSFTNTKKCDQFEKKKVDCTAKEFILMYEGNTDEFIGISITEENDKPTLYVSEKGKNLNEDWFEGYRR